MTLRPALFLTAAVTLCFYFWQNHFAAQGGAIALPKALWLGLTVFYWLLLPPLVFTRRQLDNALRCAYCLFWLPMLARAALELWLLYGAKAWQYRYGIAHDLFSCALLAFFAFRCRHKMPRVLVQTLGVMALMFAAESGFAHYISAFNHGDAHAALWFIGWEAPHTANQLATLACVSLLVFWLVHLERALHESP